MARKLTFLHAADLHIGAPFRGMRESAPRWADQLTGAITDAYDRMISTAISREVDFVVIAGDIFDSARSSYADYRRFFSGLERLEEANIPVYLCLGNHDPYSTWEQDFFALPANATVFDAVAPSFALYERDGEPLCVLGGRSFLNNVWPNDTSIADGITRANAIAALGEKAARAPFAVGVLHTGLTFDPHKAPCDPVVLQSAGMSYWALGHIHKLWVDSEDDPRIAYSGCIQGRDIREVGRRGVGIVTLEEGKPNRYEFVSTASIAWQQLMVDVGDCANVSAVVDKVMRAQFDANGHMRCDKMISRIALCGETPLHELLSQPGVVDDVRAALIESYPAFYVDALTDATTRPVDREALIEENLFPGSFLRTAREQRACPDELAAYVQREFLERNMVLPSEALEGLDDLAAEAENLVLDMLVRGEAR